jgi:hypothetical protein
MPRGRPPTHTVAPQPITRGVTVRRNRLALATLAALAAVAAATGSAAAADDVLLPHPGPDGLLWVPEQTVDGGAVSAGASPYAPTTLTVACEGGGSARVPMQ